MRGNPQAQQAGKTALTTNTGLQGNAGALFSTLAPALEAESVAPPGFTPTDRAAMNTAAQESAGGSEAAAVGRGGLLSARMRNAGGPNAAVAEGVRTAGRNLGEDALNAETENAKLKEMQRQSGLSGLARLQENQQNAALGALGQVAPDVQANTAAANESWDWAKYILDPALNAAGSAAKITAGGG